MVISYRIVCLELFPFYKKVPLKFGLISKTDVDLTNINKHGANLAVIGTSSSFGQVVSPVSRCTESNGGSLHRLSPKKSSTAKPDEANSR